MAELGRQSEKLHLVSIHKWLKIAAPAVAVLAGIFGIVDSESAKEVGALLWPGWVVAVLAALALLMMVLWQRSAGRVEKLAAAANSGAGRSGPDGVPGEVVGFKGDFIASKEMLSRVEAYPPREVDLLEYSSLAVTDLLAKLGEVGGRGEIRQVRLLVCHPDQAISDYQRDRRLAEGLWSLSYHVSADRARDMGLQVKCYRERASLRGRLFDHDLVVAGWYTYDARDRAQPAEEEISGGSNALVLATSSHSVGEAVIETFSKTFENLWRTGMSAEEAWAPYLGRVSHLPDAEWFQAVRPHHRAGLSGSPSGAG